MRIFLSYSHNDRSLAERLSKALTAKNVGVWRDVETLTTGALIWDEISTALAECGSFCVIVSQHSMSSQSVRAELNSAFMRSTQDPSFKIIPIVLEPEALPQLLRGVYYIDARSQSISDIISRVLNAVSQTQEPAASDSVDWDALLSAIERDQFIEDPKSHRFGGWSKSYPINYLPLAYPDQPPDTVSTFDSITATHWVIRGLLSLRKILLRSKDQINLLNRIEVALSRGRHYLINHFNGVGVGLVHRGAEGDRIHPDVRHSACCVKALLLLGEGSKHVIRTSAEFSILNFGFIGDKRLSTLGEVYHLIGLLKTHRWLRSASITEELLSHRESEIEDALLSSFHYLGEANGPLGLLGTSDQWHMAPYYSWWVMDACGMVLLGSANERLRNLVENVLTGLDSLNIRSPDGSTGYPISLGGYADLGATAQIGEILIRLSPKKYSERIGSIAAFLQSNTSERSISECTHHEFLWAVPHFFERLFLLNKW